MGKSLIEWVRENRSGDLRVKPFVTVFDEEMERIIIEGYENLETIETILKKLGWKVNDYNCKRLRSKIVRLSRENKIRPKGDIILDSTEMDLYKMSFENCVLFYREELEAMKNGDNVFNYFTEGKAKSLSNNGILNSGRKKKYVLSDETLLVLSKLSK